MPFTLSTADNLITLEELKDYLGDTGGALHNKYTMLINAVSQRFNTETRRDLKARQQTEYYDGDGGTELLTDNYPINSGTTATTSMAAIDIRIDTARSYSTSSKVGSTQIIIDSKYGRIRLDGEAFDSGEHSVKIVYNAGYSTTPDDLKYAAMEMCRFNLNREKDNRIGVRSDSGEGASRSYETDMPWSVRQVLDLYRNRKNG
jgi:hypothetical protein